MAVVVQAMVPAEWAGVMFTTDPVTGRRDVMVIEAVRGLGEALVSGAAKGERYVIEKATLHVLEGQSLFPHRTLQQLAARMEWVQDFTPSAVRFIGVIEALGALGLILPAATGILTWLTPLAAVGLVLVMVGVVITHVRRRDYSRTLMPIVLLMLAAFVAYGRITLIS